MSSGVVNIRNVHLSQMNCQDRLTKMQILIKKLSSNDLLM